VRNQQSSPSKERFGEPLSKIATTLEEKNGIENLPKLGNPWACSMKSTAMEKKKKKKGVEERA
jgi:hypothetical protein